MPLIISTFRKAIKGFGHKGGTERTARDLSFKYVIIGIVLVIITLCLIPSVPIGPVSALIIVVFGFFFATVSARMVGLVGSSNNPVSGMAIATLLISTIILKATGNTGISGDYSNMHRYCYMYCSCNGRNDTSQDLKTGYIVGATPVKQQVGELIGAIFSGLTIGGVLYLLNTAWEYGGSELPAPQATLMKMVVEGVMDGNIPWGLIFLGVFIAISVEIIGIPVLPFAIGLYLPIHLSMPIMVGGLVRLWYEKRKFKVKREEKKLSVTEFCMHQV